VPSGKKLVFETESNQSSFTALAIYFLVERLHRRRSNLAYSAKHCCRSNNNDWQCCSHFYHYQQRQQLARGVPPLTATNDCIVTESIVFLPLLWLPFTQSEKTVPVIATVRTKAKPRIGPRQGTGQGPSKLSCDMRHISSTRIIAAPITDNTTDLVGTHNIHLLD
jgi:hypothetical protein